MSCCDTHDGAAMRSPLSPRCSDSPAVLKAVVSWLPIHSPPAARICRSPLKADSMIRSLLVVSTLLLASHTAVAQSNAVVEVQAHGSFDDIKQMLLLAIENRGLVVSHQSPVGEMLERTGKDIGAAKRIYERAELVEFCSAT